MKPILQQIKRWYLGETRPLTEIYEEQIYLTQLDLINNEEYLEYYRLKVEQLELKLKRLQQKRLQQKV